MVLETNILLFLHMIIDIDFIFKKQQTKQEICVQATHTKIGLIEHGEIQVAKFCMYAKVQLY